jgi:hypothetical protein
MHAAAAHLMSKKSNEKSVVDHKAKRAAADAAVAASVGGTVNLSKLTEKKSRDPDAQVYCVVFLYFSVVHRDLIFVCHHTRPLRWIV